MTTTNTEAGQAPDPRHVLTPHEVEEEGLDDWRILFGVLHGRFETGGLIAGADLARAVAEAADEMDHHPDIDLTHPRVDIRLTSHDVGGVTSRDVVLARTISVLAAAVGATPRPGETSVLEVGLDTWDSEEVRPFWAALLGYEESGHDDVVDPDGTMPTIWFQSSERHETPQQRWHFDLRVPPEVAAARITRALDAGGTLVADDEAPACWVLADAQGNRACITTWQGRD